MTYLSKLSVNEGIKKHKPYVCSIEGCNAAFVYKSKLTVHLRTHSGEKPYLCMVEGCMACFAQKGQLMSHQRTHTGEKPHVCEVEGCEAAFSTRYDLTVHYRAHSGEKPYVCQVEGCKAAFATSGHLTKHNRIHSGEKPYVCKVEGCCAAFSEHGSLKVHLRTHTGEGLTPPLTTRHARRWRIGSCGTKRLRDRRQGACLTPGRPGRPAALVVAATPRGRQQLLLDENMCDGCFEFHTIEQLLPVQWDLSEGCEWNAFHDGNGDLRATCHFGGNPPRIRRTAHHCKNHQLQLGLPQVTSTPCSKRHQD